MLKLNMELVKKYPQLFWDVKPESVDLEVHKRYVIERVLESGTLESVRDLLDTYSTKEIVDVVCNSRNISAKTATYWMYRLKIKEPIKCLQTQSPAQQNGLWKN